MQHDFDDKQQTKTDVCITGFEVATDENLSTVKYAYLEYWYSSILPQKMSQYYVKVSKWTTIQEP